MERSNVMVLMHGKCPECVVPPLASDMINGACSINGMKQLAVQCASGLLAFRQYERLKVRAAVNAVSDPALNRMP